MAFNPDEVATLIVNGMVFRDWKTILVHLGILEAYGYYRFTTSEDAPPDKLATRGWPGLRIRPGDHCTVLLGGVHAISGMVTTRQVAYTGNHHVIEIIGKTYTWISTKAAATAPGQEMSNVTFQELATKLLTPLGITYEHKGAISNTKFPRVGLQGLTVWEALTSHADKVGVILGPKPRGPGRAAERCEAGL